ncbi:MAG: DUF1501 domain-containing protein, partial [Verrucomicrobiia bacterium]
MNLNSQAQVSDAQQKSTLDLIQKLNTEHFKNRDFDDSLAARVQSYELAYRMQSAAPDIVDVASESKSTLKLYGIGEEPTDEFGTRCLLARRMI